MNISNKTKHKSQKRSDRHRRVRARVVGTAARPRLCVFRSNRHIFAQLIDDQNQRTLAAADDLKLNDNIKKETKPKELKEKSSTKIKAAFLVGEIIAQKAKDLKTAKAVFDRGGYRYHGRVKSLAEGARKGGLEF